MYSKCANIAMLVISQYHAALKWISSDVLFPVVPERFPLGKLSNININTHTLEFQVHKNYVSNKDIL